MKIDGQRLEDLRIACEWTQAELAEHSGVSRDTVSKLESGARQRAHGPTVGKLAQALGVGPAELGILSSPTAAEIGPRQAGGIPLAERYRAAGSLARGPAFGELIEVATALPDECVDVLVANARALEDEERYYATDGPDGDRLDEGSRRTSEGVERKRALLGSVALALGEYELDLMIRIAGHFMAARLATAVVEGKAWEDAKAENLRREESRGSASAGRPR